MVAVAVEVGTMRSRVTPEMRAWMAKLDHEGVPRAQIRRRLIAEHGVDISVQWIGDILGPKPGRGEGANRRPTSINVEPELMEAARRIAANLGYRTLTGNTAGEGSISRLIEAIGRGEVEVSLSRRRR
jgi:hypothetical protein